MKFLVAFSALLALAAARPGFLHAPLAYVAPVVPVSSQYHSQDTLGQYAYGYSAPLSAKSESRSVDGVTSGAYSYVDAEGKVQHVSYTADAVNGFRVAGTNVPVAPEAPKQDEPKPVEDTAEVAEAKAEHSAAVDAIKARDAAIVAADPGDNAVEVVHPVVHAVPYVYNYASPAVHYVQPYSAYYHHVPSVYGYHVPYYTYTNGHPASDLPHDDEAVAKARSEHEAAHKEVKAKLAEAGAEV